MCYSECVEVKGQLVGISSLLHHVGSRHWTHVVSRGGKHLHLLCCLAGPVNIFLFNCCMVLGVVRTVWSPSENLQCTLMLIMLYATEVRAARGSGFASVEGEECNSASSRERG